MSERTEARATLDKSMSGRGDLQPAVIAHAQSLGWSCYWTWRSDHSPSGFPDLVLCRPPRLVIAELKKEGKELTVKQAEWLDRLMACGIECHVWRPIDLSSGLIQAILA